MNNNDKLISIEISHTKMIAILSSSFIIFLIAIFFWKQQEIDYNILIKNNIIYENELYLQFFKYISRFGMGIISIMYSLLIFLSFQKEELKHNSALFLYIIFCFALSSITGDLLQQIIDRTRPAVELSGRIKLTKLSDTPSFPSGHSTKSMGLALPFVIMALNKDPITKIFKILVSLFAVLVCYSRIALQKHFLSDVLAGIAIALFFVFIAVWVVNLVYKRRNIDEKRLSVLIKKIGFIFIGLAIMLSII